jgi:hypothetical protein
LLLLRLLLRLLGGSGLRGRGRDGGAVPGGRLAPRPGVLQGVYVHVHQRLHECALHLRMPSWG